MVRDPIPSGTWNFFQAMHHFLVANFHIRKNVLVFENFFVLLAPYVCFHSFSQVKVTEWPPTCIGKIAAHSAYDMFHGISA